MFLFIYVLVCVTRSTYCLLLHISKVKSWGKRKNYSDCERMSFR